MEFEFTCDYAKSNRAVCRGCQTTIVQDTLRIAIMLQSNSFDGKVPNWYHQHCFFVEHMPHTSKDIENFDLLQWNDQELIREVINAGESPYAAQENRAQLKRDISKANSKASLKNYTIEYTKVARTKCTHCDVVIMKDELRIVKKASQKNQVYHFNCFIKKHIELDFLESGTGIKGFADLCEEDQELVKELLPGSCEIPSASQENKAQLKRHILKASSKASLKNYTIEYTKAGRTKCTHCIVVIKKDELRIVKKAPKKNQVYHFNCFLKIHKELDFLECGSGIKGFEDLSAEDQELVKQELPGSCETPPKKKRPSTEVITLKIEEDKPCSSKELVSKDYNNIMHKYRQEMKSNLKKNEIGKLLKFNGQAVPAGIENMLDRACDMLTYGALLRCQNCRNGQLIFSNLGYKCSGSQNAWTKCHFITANPIRNHVQIPQDMRLRHDFLYKYEYVPRKRIIAQEKPERVTSGPLKYKNIFIHGFSQEETTNLYNKVNSLAGRVVNEIKRSVFCVISHKNQVEINTKVIQEAKECEIYVVEKDFLNNLKGYVNLDDLARKYSLVDWGVELHQRIPDQFKKTGQKIRRFGEEEEGGKRKMKIKNGIAIEPDSLLDHIAHVYQSGSVVFNAVLSKTDITTNTNSFYKMQLLESDDLRDFWVYYGWGRTGTKNAASTVKQFDTLAEAQLEFKNNFQKMTGSKWENRYSMKKKPGAYVYIEVSYDAQKDEIQDLNVRVADSTLKPAVAQLMAMIFNVEAMEKMMLEYELDLQKMPLGKLSRTQIKAAYQILTEIGWAFQRHCQKDEIIAYTNKFYSYMPYASQLERPPLLDNKQIIKKKSDMLADLLEMETAYSIIQRGANGEGGNPLDAYYNQLKALIDPLEENSSEFKLIEEYVHNTHADTHRNYDLKILEIFKVARDGEEDRFDKCKEMKNRRLLWHGSRKTNFAGILSQGLRIAPPEAPVTGYMFGKGIYFADMVSKSANYCCTTRTDSEGLLLLCEVALGNIEDKIRAEDVRRLPKDIHSVRGVGQTEPNPEEMKTLEDGLQIPVGKPVKKTENTNLLYNEYIVYDVSQVKIKYLLKMDFKYKY